MFHTIMHPKHVSSNLLHNFAPVFAPTSTLSKESGYAWYGIAGIDEYQLIIDMHLAFTYYVRKMV